MTINSAALKNGTRIAKNVISADIMQRIGALMEDCLGNMQTNLEMKVSGMTGNTLTSPAGATYEKGKIEKLHITSQDDNTRPPLAARLKQGAKWAQGRQRYDGGVQSKTFTADVETSGNTIQRDNAEFLKSQQSSEGFKMIIAGGTEYAGMSQVADNFTFCQNIIDQYFKHNGNL